MRRLAYANLIVCILLSLVFVAAANAAPARADRGEWAPNVWYNVGDTVTYNGCTYTVIQAHTSLSGWEPPNVPALFSLVGCGTVSTNTPTRTPVGPTNTPTRTPTQGGGGGNCWPAWNASTAYNGGAQVSYNGQNYQAAYWTQGDQPDTHSGPAGSGQPWIPKGSCGGSVTNTPTKTNTPFGPTNTPTRTPTRTPTCAAGSCGGGTKILGYFTEWGIYPAHNYHVKNIVTSGSASKLTHINYAFGTVTNGLCAVYDSYADYERSYDATLSVDGVADTWDQPLRGNFNQLRKLKQMYPNIKILWSFGGWTLSGGFTQAAANPTAFANSCYNLVHDPRWNGLFDGIDIDWEYPNACGLTCDTSGYASFKNLMAALRTRFGSELVTAAVPAGYSNINAADYGGAAQYVNWYNVMTYDFFGAWAATGPTAPHSPLYSYAGIPQANFYGDYAIQLYKQKGVPASKLLLGIGFYGRGWTGVSNTNGGLGQSASGPAQGIEPGVQDYKVLATSCPPTGTVAGTAYAYCSGNWWSYDTPATIAGKMSYKKNQGLGGAFFWELSGDTGNGALITALYNNR